MKLRLQISQDALSDEINKIYKVAMLRNTFASFFTSPCKVWKIIPSPRKALFEMPCQLC